MVGTPLTEKQLFIKAAIINNPSRFVDVYLPSPGENFKVVKDMETGYCYLQSLSIWSDGNLLLLKDSSGKPLQEVC